MAADRSALRAAANRTTVRRPVTRRAATQTPPAANTSPQQVIALAGVLSHQRRMRRNQRPFIVGNVGGIRLPGNAEAGSFGRRASKIRGGLQGSTHSLRATDAIALTVRAWVGELRFRDRTSAIEHKSGLSAVAAIQPSVRQARRKKPSLPPVCPIEAANVPL